MNFEKTEPQKPFDQERILQAFNAYFLDTSGSIGMTPEKIKDGARLLGGGFAVSRFGPMTKEQRLGWLERSEELFHQNLGVRPVVKIE